MDLTALTVGGFTQPIVAKTLIELPSSAEEGLAQRFLWILPQPKFSTFESLQLVDDNFTRYLGKKLILCTYCYCVLPRPFWYSGPQAFSIQTSVLWLPK